MEAALTTLPLETLIQWRTDALEAYQKILTGEKVTYVAHQGAQKTYKVKSAQEMAAYIASLNNAIAAKQSPSGGPTRAPIYTGMGF